LNFPSPFALMPHGRRWGGDRTSGYGEVAEEPQKGNSVAPQAARRSVHEVPQRSSGTPSVVPGMAPKVTGGDHKVVLQPGFHVENDGREGEVEFVPSCAQGGRGQVLVNFSKDPEALDGLAWVPCKELKIIDSHSRRLNERADVRAYRDAVKAIKLGLQGASISEVAAKLGRPEAWTREKLGFREPSKLPKPKGMEWWDPDGFCEVTYLKGYAKESGLYEEIVQGVEWEQDKVWRVRKQEDSNDWHLRTVKECPGKPGRGFCGRSLQKVPDLTHQIGPQDIRRAARTLPHADWACERADDSAHTCQKPSRDSPHVEPYWFCSKCSWYACNACVKQMPDKATSKQVSHWRPGSCPKLDELVADLVRDFHLPDPMHSRYTVKMNWYPDAYSRVSPHRHDNWTLLVSLGSPRVLTVDRARVLMEDGDVILFGTQSHGVPEFPACKGGRLSLVLMFAPCDSVANAAMTRAEAGGAALRRAGPQPPGLPPAPSINWMAGPETFDNDDDDEIQWVPDLDADGAGSSVVAAEAFTELCSMGFPPQAAKAALAAVDGNVQEATNLLLAAGA